MSAPFLRHLKAGFTIMNTRLWVFVHPAVMLNPIGSDFYRIKLTISVLNVK